MPITGRWRSLRTESAPEAPGVYELGDFNGSVLYIGSSSNLNRSIARQVNGQELYVEDRAVLFRCEQTAMFVTQLRQLLWEYRQTNGGLPPYNDQNEPA